MTVAPKTLSKAVDDATANNSNPTCAQAKRQSQFHILRGRMVTSLTERASSTVKNTLGQLTADNANIELSAFFHTIEHPAKESDFFGATRDLFPDERLSGQHCNNESVPFNILIICAPSGTIMMDTDHGGNLTPTFQRGSSSSSIDYIFASPTIAAGCSTYNIDSSLEHMHDAARSFYTSLYSPDDTEEDSISFLLEHAPA
ncbi:hypothetical protein BDB00DRAFT_872955 [Zychaea mexicana]|uniref:uncharacterized protein n=1 Tax=Zychaea mexicana TaxID=64656 RepID=UPI0022FE62F4|nr:uncharacterized protein BDB00DRAFT_872955 [Zychaea mexicana]KAI9492909.1 hypothetical protein BDB00DRAFT_872955 [Zychaea mexicana]